MELAHLPERERYILERRRAKMSRRLIGEELDITPERVRQIEMMAERHLAETRTASTAPRLGRNVMTPVDMWHQIEQERLRGDFYRALEGR